MMQYLGISYEMRHAPKLDPTFVPFGVWREAYLEGAKHPIAIAVSAKAARCPCIARLFTIRPKWPRPITAAWSAM